MRAPVIDVRTGEVLDGAQAGAYLAEVNGLAAEFVAVSAAHKAAAEEIAQLRTRREGLASALRELLPSEGTADGGTANVVRAPAPRPSQRVSRSGCERHAERLLGMGIGSMGYQAPGIAEVRRRRAEIIAAGIPLDEIAPEPMAGPDTIEIVPKAAS